LVENRSETEMGRAPREITDTELSLLTELWQRPSATVPELTEALYGNTQPALLATVRKLLDRLEAKALAEVLRELPVSEGPATVRHTLPSGAAGGSWAGCWLCQQPNGSGTAGSGWPDCGGQPDGIRKNPFEEGSENQ
jgi:hypothetical protein